MVKSKPLPLFFCVVIPCSRPTGVYANGQQLQAYYYNAAGDITAVADIPDRQLIRTVPDAAGRVAEENTYEYTGTATDTQTVLNELLLSTAVKSQAVYGYDKDTGYLREESNTTPLGTTTYDYTYGDMSVGEMPDAVYTVESTPTLTGKAEKVTYEYDTLGRVESRTVYLNGGTAKTTTYTYKAGGHGANSTTTQLDTMTTDGVTYRYVYDKVGRITKITKNGAEVESYVYDSLGQLTQVKKNGSVVASYTYDNGGNITSATVNGVTHTYTYGNSTWKDQLTAFDGNTITYDALGNPLTYYDGATMTWANGRNLTNYTKGDTTVTFGYASDNTRATKTVNGVTTTYYYVGGRLYGEKTYDPGRGYDTLIYLYDDTGSPYGYIYNDTTYYYERNAQGDVIGIWHQNGTKIVNYTYDAWGNVTSIINQYGEDVTDRPRHQGNLNPIRYRGYYYDAELNMYWLTTRFYDPETGRFINADGQINDSLFGGNLYAYCTNDPINAHDPMGTCACNTMGFDCSNCRRAAKGKFLYDRPRRLDLNSMVPPTMINPYEDFGAPNSNDFYIFAEATFVYEVPVLEAIGRQIWAVARMELHNKIVENIGGKLSDPLETYLFLQAGIPTKITEDLFKEIVINQFSVEPDEVNIVPGTYTVTVALYTDGQSVMRIKRIDGPSSSSKVHGWRLRGDIDQTMEERGQLWDYFEKW